MDKLLAFVVEHTMVNSAPIFLAAGALAFLLGPFLINLGANKYVRTLIYAIGGVAAGLASYAMLTIPDRPIEFLEGLSLAVGMLAYGIIFIGAVVLIRASFKKKHDRHNEKSIGSDSIE